MKGFKLSPTEHQVEEEEHYHPDALFLRATRATSHHGLPLSPSTTPASPTSTSSSTSSTSSSNPTSLASPIGVAGDRPQLKRTYALSKLEFQHASRNFSNWGKRNHSSPTAEPPPRSSSRKETRSRRNPSSSSRDDLR